MGHERAQGAFKVSILGASARECWRGLSAIIVSQPAAADWPQVAKCTDGGGARSIVRSCDVQIGPARSLARTNTNSTHWHSYAFLCLAKRAH